MTLHQASITRRPTTQFLPLQCHLFANVTHPLGHRLRLTTSRPFLLSHVSFLKKKTLQNLSDPTKSTPPLLFRHVAKDFTTMDLYMTWRGRSGILAVTWRTAREISIKGNQKTKILFPHIKENGFLTFPYNAILI